MKKLNITFLLTMLVSMVGLNASAYSIAVKNADGITIYYNYNNSTELAVTYKSSDYYSYSNDYIGKVVIPESVTYNGKTYSVTKIGEWAFSGCSGLTSITIPSSVTSIGESAFSGCSGLTSITIPNSVTSIGESAFSGCSGLTSITIPNSVTSIGSSAFSGTAWYGNQLDGLVYAGKLAYKYKGTMPRNTSITIKDGTWGIAGGAFYGCSGLTSIDIPNSVTSIGYRAFYGCSGLTSITIPSSVTSIGESAFYGCSGLTSITIPNSVTSIGKSAFYGCKSLTSVTIPNSVTSIGDQAFKECTSLTSVTIPNSVTSIGVDAFYLCTSLTSVNIPNSVTSIGKSAFYGCRGLTSITIPNSVTSIGGGAFYGCRGLTSITIPNSVTSIGDQTFRECESLTSATIPNSVTSIGDQMFMICPKLTSVDIPNSVTSIGEHAFYACTSLTSVTIPNSVTSIGEYAFFGCKITSVTIPNSVISIGSNAFAYCSKLTTITIGNSMTSIRDNAFDDTDILTIISLMENPTTIAGKTSSSRSFSINTFNNSTLYVPKGTIDKYKKRSGWKDFKDIREMTDEEYNEIVKKTNGDGSQEGQPEETIINLFATISSAGYATFYNDSRNFKLPASLSALVLTSESGQTLNYKTIASGDANGIVPKGVPVILVSNSRRGGTYTLTSTTESASYSGENLLHGSSLMTMTSNVNGVSTTGNSNYVYYKLAYGKSGSTNANKLGWYWGATNGAAFTIAGGKAWLALPKSSAQSLDAILLEEDDVTSIDGIEQSNMNEANDAQYNMAGQRVGNGYNGIVIVNGKKVIR